MSNPFEPGKTEGMYCSVDYNGKSQWAKNIDVGSLIGNDNLSSIYNNMEKPKDWCADWSDGCVKYQGRIQWMPYPDIPIDIDIYDINFYPSIALTWNNDLLFYS